MVCIARQRCPSPSAHAFSILTHPGMCCPVHCSTPAPSPHMLSRAGVPGNRPPLCLQECSPPQGIHCQLPPCTREWAAGAGAGAGALAPCRAHLPLRAALLCIRRHDSAGALHLDQACGLASKPVACFVCLMSMPGCMWCLCGRSTIVVVVEVQNACAMLCHDLFMLACQPLSGGVPYGRTDAYRSKSEKNITHIHAHTLKTTHPCCST